MTPPKGDNSGAINDKTTQQAGADGQTNLSDWVAMAYGPNAKSKTEFTRVADTKVVAQGDRSKTPDNGTIELLDHSKVTFENGRVAATMTAKGDITTFHYAGPEKNARIDAYKVTDDKGTVLEDARLEKSGVWSMNGNQDRGIVDVKVGSRFQLEMRDKDNIIHARTLSGNAIRIDQNLPDQVLQDGRRVPAVTAEMTDSRRRSDFEYKKVQGPDGQPASVLDNYTVKDADGHIKKFGILRPDGKWLQFEAKPNEQELDAKAIDNIKNMMHKNPSQLLKEKPLADHVVNDPGRKATNVEVIADGRRIETHESGTKTWETPAGNSRLIYAKSESDRRGTKQELVDYDHDGRPIRLSERLTTIEGGKTVNKDYTLTRQADGWYDETGTKRDIQVQSTKDGSLLITYGGKLQRQINIDGTEQLRRAGDSQPVQQGQPDERQGQRYTQPQPQLNRRGSDDMKK